MRLEPELREALALRAEHDHETGTRSLMPSQPMATVVGMPKKYRDVRKALLEAGWRVVRQAGSHEVWAHVDHSARIVVAGKNRDTVPVGTLGSIRRVSGLEHLR